ncbi:diaminopimelate decarboxylase/L-glutamyl-[BtrI acyl-carrier protein] decarboxylase [Paenibacillus sp. DS2015]|uniref:type III PLP-dependent enzyme n=1 Tax=Paenibacillus sp. DS2015 TaxID=3373917 RepID=UPI003D228A27
MIWSDEKIKVALIKHPTPFYLYDQEILINTYKGITQLLHPSVDVYLSLKSNNNVYLTNLFCQMGSGIEIASAGELHLAIKSGFPMNRIIYSGPGKTQDDLKVAVNTGIRCVIVESLEEARILSGVAMELGKNAAYAVRVNPDINGGKTAISMGGGPRQFGVDESQLEAFFANVSTLPSLDFMGIHVYMGTQILQKDVLIDMFNYTLNLARTIIDKYKMPVRMVDLGGGFGVPYFTHEKPLDMEGVLIALNHMLDKYLIDFPDTNFVIESGRYLLAASGIYAAKILYKKESKGETFLITNGGMHHHAAATFRGRAMKGNFPMKVIRRNAPSDSSHQTISETVNVTGVLCTPEDCLARKVEVPIAEPGDWVVWFNSGAYGLSFSPIHFLGHPTPMELLMVGDQLNVIRNKGSESDLLLHQNIKFEPLLEGSLGHARC